MPAYTIRINKTPEPPEPRLPANTRPFLIVLPLVAAAAALLVIALPALHGPLVLDSLKLHALEGVFQEHGDRAVLHTPAFGGGLHRIVAMASFVLNIQAAGELSAYQVKLTNAGIHVITGLVIFLLTRLILRHTPYGRWAAGVALGTTVLWLLSPLNFNVAMYGVQRMAQLAALFTFAGLACYTAGRLHDRMGFRVLYIALAAVVCLPLAVLSKQNGVMLVPLAFLVEVYFLHPARPWLTRRQLTLIAVVGTAAAATLLLYLYPGVLNYQTRDFTLGERLLSQPRALVSYLQHLVAPYGGDTGIYTDDFRASRTLLAPLSTALSLIAFAAIALFCAVCHAGRFKPVAFGLAFFLVGHALESSFIPLELYFLHRNYLPGYGVYLALVALLAIILPERRWLVIALTLYAAYFAAISYARSMTWSSHAGIVSSAINYHPDSPRALSNYAQLAAEAGRFDLANAAVDRSIALSGTLKTQVQRLYIRCRSGEDPGARDYTALAETRSFGVSNEISQALGNLLALYERGGCPRLRVPQLVQSLDGLAARFQQQGRNPWTITFYTDAFLYASGARQAAHRRLQTRLDQGHLESGLYRLELLIQEASREQARSVLSQIEEQFAATRLQKFEGALREFRQQIEDTL